MRTKWMNTLMNAYNRRAEVAATLTNTMGRQKLGSSPLQPSRAACRKETERRREREKVRVGGWETRRKEKTSLAGQRTCIICREEARLFHAGWFRQRWRGGRHEETIKLLSIGNEIVRAGETTSVAFVLLYAGKFLHARRLRRKRLLSAGIRRRWKDGTNRSPSLAPFDAPWHRFFWQASVHARCTSPSPCVRALHCQAPLFPSLALKTPILNLIAARTPGLAPKLVTSVTLNLEISIEPTKNYYKLKKILGIKFRDVDKLGSFFFI